MKIAIVRLSAMGDIIHSAFIIDAIKQKHPHAVIDWMCEATFAPLLEDHAHINCVHTVNLKAIKKSKNIFKLFVLMRTIKSWGPYDVVIDLQGLIKSAVIARLLGSVRYGFDTNGLREKFAVHFYSHTVSCDYSQNVLWRTALLTNEALKTNITTAYIDTKPNVLQADSSVSKEAIYFIVGSSQAYKSYPKERIAQTINLLQKPVTLIWGTQQEKEAAHDIAKQSSFADVGHAMTLIELKSALSHAALVIGADTGPTYLAWAFNRPSIVLYGATSAKRSMWQTATNVAIESASIANDWHTCKTDFSVGDIDPKIVADTARSLLAT